MANAPPLAKYLSAVLSFRYFAGASSRNFSDFNSADMRSIWRRKASRSGAGSDVFALASLARTITPAVASTAMDQIEKFATAGEMMLRAANRS